MYYCRLWMAAIAIAGCLLGQTAIATEAPLNQTAPTLGLRDALEATLAHNPQLASFHFRTDILQGERQTAALKPALSLNLEAENIAGTDTYRGTDNAEVTLALSQVIELGDKRAARLDIMTERQRSLEAEQRVLELDILADTTHRFIAVAAAQEQLALQKKAVQLARETLAVVERRVAAGHTPDAELARARATLARLIIEQQHASVELASKRIALSLLWADTRADFNVSADLFALAKPAPLDQLIAGMDNSPDIRQLASAERLSNAELQAARRDSRPDLEWSAGIRRFQASGDAAVVVGLNIPLASSTRATGAITSANARQLAASNARDTATLQLRGQFTALYGELNQAIDAVASLQRDVLPQLQSALRDTRAAFDKGRYSYLEWSAAQRELFEAELALIDAATRAHDLRAELERLSGSAVPAINTVIDPAPAR